MFFTVFDKRTFLFILIIFVYFNLFSQKKYYGSIKDNLGDPIPSAIIKIQKNNSNIIYSYVYSNLNGEFYLKDLDKNNTTLIISKLGYYTVNINMNSFSDSNSLFVLQKKYFTLPQVLIKNSAIYNQSDTINYFVKAFEQKHDLVLGNVLARLPGIEVTSSGQIKYQGIAINKLYIEGQDLLDNKYALATNNIPIHAIDQIQVFERHQPIKAIDSIAFSNQAAINIKIRKDYKKKIFGRGKLASTTFYPLSVLELIPMNFSDYQFIGSLKFNNVGNEISIEQTSFNTETLVDDLRGYTRNMDLINIFNMNIPNIDKARYLNNNTKIFTFNTISSNKKKYQLRYNIDYLRDYQDQHSLNTNNYKYGEEVITQTDNGYSKSKNENIKTNISFIANHQKSYIKNNFIFENIDKYNSGKLIIFNDTNSQFLKNNFKNVINKFSLIKVIGKTSASFGSYLSYSTTNQNLELPNSYLPIIINNKNIFGDLNQRLLLSTFYLNNYFSISKKFKYLNFESRVGNWNTIQFFNSKLYNTNLNNFSIYDSADIQSKNRQSNFYQSFSTSYISKNIKIAINIPVNIYIDNVYANNFKYKSKTSFRTEYSFSGVFSFSNRLNLTTEHSLNYIPSSPYLNSKGYILNNYRSLSNNNGNESNYLFHNTKINFNYKDIKNMIFLTLSYGSEKNISNVSVDRFFKNGFIINKLIMKENISFNNKYTFSFNKYIYSLKSSFITGMSFENYFGLQFKSSIPYSYRNNLFSYILKSNSKISNYVIEYSFNYQNQKVTNTLINNNIFKNEISTYTDISKNVYLKLNLDNYTYRNRSYDNKNFSFLDISLFTKSIFKKNIFELGVRNLFNIYKFDSYLVSNNISSYTNFDLRERYFYLSFDFTF
jgi:hypothetical protein